MHALPQLSWRVASCTGVILTQRQAVVARYIDTLSEFVQRQGTATTNHACSHSLGYGGTAI
jgi:hypothetical protein